MDTLALLLGPCNSCPVLRVPDQVSELHAVKEELRPNSKAWIMINPLGNVKEVGMSNHGWTNSAQVYSTGIWMFRAKYTNICSWRSHETLGTVLHRTYLV